MLNLQTVGESGDALFSIPLSLEVAADADYPVLNWFPH